MKERRLPPASINAWLKQFDKDPDIPAEFKNGAQNQLKLCNKSFSSGSTLKPSESLQLRTIWYRYSKIKDLRNLMMDDPQTGYKGYVSAKSMSMGNDISNAKESQWQPYLDEVKMRSDQATTSTGAPAVDLSDNTAVPLESLRPSEECKTLRGALQKQCLVLKKVNKDDPTDEELSRAFFVSKPGPDPEPEPSPAPISFAINRPITPPRFTFHDQTEEDTPIGGAQSTPEVWNYYPARGGQANQPAADENFVSTAIVDLVEGITVDVGVEFSSMDWVERRLPFKLSERVTTMNFDTGEETTRMRELMEARVDGYLFRSPSPFETRLETAPLAIIEAKPYTRSSALSSIRRQEGAEMACWISQAGDSTTGLLRSSRSGRKRRLMISQDRHEIYIIVGEYGAGYEQHVRPSSLVLKGSAASQQKTAQTSSSTSGGHTQPDSLSAATESTANRRDPRLLAGSPSYVGRVERKSIGVADGPTSHEKQPTQAGPEMAELPGTDQKWIPDAGDFLIMHEFGPFLITDAGHMKVFAKRLVAFMMELRGAHPRFVPRRPGPQFLFQRNQAARLPMPKESSHQRRNLRKARSWAGMDQHEWPSDHNKAEPED